MGLVDLKDAYHLISVAEEDRKFLRILFKGQLYEYTAVPFGLCSAPLLFTKLMKPVISLLRAEGFISVN